MEKKFIQWLNRTINNAGMDKVLHFAVGAWITAIFLGVWAVACDGLTCKQMALASAVSLLVTLAVSVYKERRLDDRRDCRDVTAALWGWLYTFLIILTAVAVF